MKGWGHGAQGAGTIVPSRTARPDGRGVSADGTTDARFELSAAHVRAVHRVISGGAHALAKGADQYPENMAPVIVEGSGCRVRDLDGNELIEYGIGLRSVTLGHGDRRVVSAVKMALDSGVNFTRPHVLERRAAERLLELFPFADMVKFGLNGSDAISAAVRVARGFTGRDRIAVCADHPMFGTADWFICTTPMSAGIPRAHHELTASFRYNDLSSVEAVLNSAPGEFAALVLEAETTVPPQPGFFDGIRALCDRHGTLLILDEIITGFRWHQRGAQYVHGIRPDLCTLGKGLANGLPLSALLRRREVMDLGGFAAGRDRVYLLSQTYGAQPWVLAAMLTVIDVYESDAIVSRLHATGARLRQEVDAVVSAGGARISHPGSRTGLQSRLRHARRLRRAQSRGPDVVSPGAAPPSDPRPELGRQRGARRRRHRSDRSRGRRCAPCV